MKDDAILNSVFMTKSSGCKTTNYKINDINEQSLNGIFPAIHNMNQPFHFKKIKIILNKK